MGSHAKFSHVRIMRSHAKFSHDGNPVLSVHVVSSELLTFAEGGLVSRLSWTVCL